MFEGMLALGIVAAILIFTFALCNAAADDREDDRDEW